MENKLFYYFLTTADSDALPELIIFLVLFYFADAEISYCLHALEQIYDKQEMTPLHCAANYNNPEVVELLLEARADPEAYDENYSTPLHLAATTGNKEIVLLLLDAFEKRKTAEKLKQVSDYCVNRF